MNNSHLFKLTQLSEASYANFYNAIVYEQQVDALKDKDFSQTQAESLLSKWSVASHQRNTSSGFSATLFQSKDDTSDYVLAIRGTEPLTLTDLATDLGDIVRDGLAIDQVVDLYNYWQQLQAPEGASYKVAALETDWELTADYYAAKAAGPVAFATYTAYLHTRTDIVIDEPKGLVKQINLDVNSFDIYTDERREGLGIDIDSITVVGHSLGGHLAAAFSRLFPDATADALMVNGAGFGDEFAIATGTNGPFNVSNLFSMLEGADSFNSDKIINLVGSAGIDMTSQDSWLGLSQPGLKQYIQTESCAPISTAFGHGASQMTDSMAVYDLFFRLDETLAGLDPQAAIDFLEPVLKAGSANDDFILESLVNSLGRLFVNNYQDIAFSSIYRDGARDEMFSRITKIIAALPESGTSLLSIAEASAGSIANLAKVTDARGIACRYALQQLNQFIVVGADYSRFNQNAELDRIDPDTGSGSLSDSWITDRAAMLTWIMKANTEQGVSEPDRITIRDDQLTGDGWFFDDRITGKTVHVWSQDQLLSDYKHKVVFGKESTDFIEGDLLSDRLYGGGGTDTILGKGDNDYIEGGKGDDLITGGKGDDVLVGGEGKDTYFYTVGDGNDRIIDSGENTIIIDDGMGHKQTINKFFKTGAEVWTSIDGQIQLTHHSPWQIVLPDGGIIELGESLQDGDFGIHLLDAPTTPEPATTIAGDLTPTQLDPDNYEYDSLGNVVTDPDSPAPGREDFLYDSEGNDLIESGGGNDTIVAKRGGDDRILGGAGRDAITSYNEGGAASDNDIIEGGADGDVILGGPGDDQLFAEDMTETSFLVSHGEVAESIAEKGDLVSGGVGNDTVCGSDRIDALFGGEGDDLIVGGGGDDVILGDDRVTTANLDWNFTITSDPGVEFSDLDFIRATAGGADTIYAGTGNDFVYAGGGNDEVQAGEGADIVYGEGGADVIFGGAGNDLLDGDGQWLDQSEHGSDYLDGGDGNDRIWGGGASDFLFGGEGDDEIAGGDGDDYLDGEAGADLLIADAGNDEIFGGDGDDELQGISGDDYLDGEAGNDLLFGDDGNDELFGGSGDDDLYGGEDNDYLDGEAGADLLFGEGGDDVIFGGDDDDVLLGEAGSDYLDGEAGADLLSGGEGDDILFGGDGDDELQGGDGNDILDGEAGADFIFGEAGDDELYGGEGDDWIQGGDGNDYLDGVMGSNTLLGGIGNDEIYGAEGSDVIQGDDGDDYMDGGEGDDMIIGCAGNDVIYGADGNDQLHGDSNDIPVSSQGNDIIYGEAGNDVINGYSGDDTLLGGEGDDYIMGDDTSDDSTGDDYIDGGTGNDILRGMAGNDTILGGDGDDLLISDPGNDILLGGTGFDTYAFNLGDGNDIITDTSEDGIGNAISFGEGISRDSLSTYIDGNDLIIIYGDRGDSIRITDFDPANGINPDKFGCLQLFDGSSVSFLELSNHPPREGEGILSDLTTSEDEPFSFQVPENAFMDEDGDPLTYNSTTINGEPLPSWLVFDPETRTFSGTPGNDNVGSIAVAVTASDEFGAEATRSFTINVENVNDIPQVSTPLVNQTAVEDETFTFLIPGGTFTDIDANDTLTYSTSLANGDTLPDWLAFDPYSQTFSGTPANDNVGSLDVTVTATDLSGASANSTFSITVENVNDAPVVTIPLDDQSITEEETFTFHILDGAFTDVDAGDTLSYSAALADGNPLPDWLTFDATTGTFSGTPTSNSIGNLDISVTALDTLGASVSDTFKLSILPKAGETIIGTDGDDILTGTTGNDILDGRGGKDTLSADAGNDTLIFSADTRAAWYEMAINLGSPGVLGSFAIEMISGKNLSRDTYDGGEGIDELTATESDDAIILDRGLFSGPKISNIERIKAGAGNDLVNLTSFRYGYGDVVIDGGVGNDVLWANAGNDTLFGGEGDDKLDGGAGQDTLLGGSGNDLLRGGREDDLLYGEEGIDTLIGGSGNDSFMGGTGDDTIYTGSGNDRIAFNKGDGCDTVIAYGDGADTIRLGGGISSDDLILVKNDLDLVLESGENDAIILKGWYESSLNRDVQTLQIIHNASADFSEPLLPGQTIETFDFATLVSEFDLARAGDPTLSSWKLSDSITALQANYELLPTVPGESTEPSFSNPAASGLDDKIFTVGSYSNADIPVQINADPVFHDNGNAISSDPRLPHTTNTAEGSGTSSVDTTGLRYDYSDLPLNVSSNNISWKNTSAASLLDKDGATNQNHIPTQTQSSDPVFLGNGNGIWSDPKLPFIENIDDGNFINTSAKSAINQPWTDVPNLTRWELNSALSHFHLSSNVTESLGGDLAGLISTTVTLSGSGATATRNVFTEPGFGAASNSLKPASGLQEGMIKLG